MSIPNTLSILVHAVENKTQIWEDALEQGNAIKANRIAEEIKDILNEIRNNDMEGQDALLLMTKHRNKGMRYWSAMYLLRSNPEESLATLTDLEKNKGVVSMFAYTALYLFKSGEIEMP